MAVAGSAWLSQPSFCVWNVSRACRLLIQDQLDQQIPGVDREEDKSTVEPISDAENDPPNVRIKSVVEEEEIADNKGNIAGVPTTPLRGFDVSPPEEEIIFEPEAPNNKNTGTESQPEQETVITRAGRESKPPTYYVPAFKGSKYAFTTVLNMILETDA